MFSPGGVTWTQVPTASPAVVFIIVLVMVMVVDSRRCGIRRMVVSKAGDGGKGVWPVRAI